MPQQQSSTRYVLWPGSSIHRLILIVVSLAVIFLLACIGQQPHTLISDLLSGILNTYPAIFFVQLLSFVFCFIFYIHFTRSTHFLIFNAWFDFGFTSFYHFIICLGKWRWHRTSSGTPSPPRTSSMTLGADVRHRSLQIRIYGAWFILVALMRYTNL